VLPLWRGGFGGGAATAELERLITNAKTRLKQKTLMNASHSHLLRFHFVLNLNISSSIIKYF
jgi:hypothetical protein